MVAIVINSIKNRMLSKPASVSREGDMVPLPMLSLNSVRIELDMGKEPLQVLIAYRALACS
jgi:hypothetical protein